MALLSLALTGCSASGQRKPQAPPSASAHAQVTVVRVSSFASVDVSVSPSLPADRRARLDAAEGTSRLKRSLEAKLGQTGRLDAASPYALEVTIESYRMRSGAAVFWVGAMAGADSVGVNVTVRDAHNAVVRTYSTGAGSIGAWSGLDQISRLENILEATARRILEEL